MRKARLTPLQHRQVALEALCDERTLKRVLSGAPVRELSVERIRRALLGRGLPYLLPESAKGARK
jgi:hypothetical protein